MADGLVRVTKRDQETAVTGARREQRWMPDRGGASGVKTTRASLVASVLGVALIFLFGSAAAAQTTHKYLFSFPIASDGQVGGVDAQGNVYVYSGSGSYTLDNKIEKFAFNGTEYVPANFSALGTNVINGAGGGNCPATPADCDEVPRGGLDGTYSGTEQALSVDPRASGPGAGDLYVSNLNFEPEPGHIEVFAPSGEFVGEVDNTITYPSRCVGFCAMEGSSVNAKGHIFVAYCCGAEADQWAPKDANPAHDEFVGQLRDGWSEVVGGVNYAYGLGGKGTGWQKYTASEWLKQRGESEWLDFSPAPGPFGLAGDYPEGNDFFHSLSIDPANEHVYLSGAGPTIQEWNPENERVGQPFVDPEGFPDGVGFDHSGGPHDGDLFMRGSGNTVAVFSGPVTIPDVGNAAVSVGHTTAHISGSVSPAGGPEVTGCQIEYGGTTSYGLSQPCSPSPPYSAPTAVAADISGLAPENNYHFRVVATNENGNTVGADQTLRPAAVLGLSTDPATIIDGTQAVLNGSLNADGLETTYHFQYGIGTGYGQTTSTMNAGAGTGLEPVVGAEIGQLQPGHLYHYRIVAENSLGITRGPDRTFRAAISPAISGVRTRNVTSTSADLVAQIDSFGYDTTYHFEYGPSTSYGSSIPPTDADMGSADEAKEVTAHAENLTPGVTYHFRVVATSQWGTTTGDDTTFTFTPPTCPNEHLRQQTDAAYLPDCRAYELVSPDEAGGVQLFPSDISRDLGKGFGLQDNPLYSVTPQNSGLASTPSRFAYFGGLGAIEGFDVPNSWIDMYVATRTAQGWITTYPGLPGSKALTVARPQCALTLDKCLDYHAPGTVSFGQEDENAPYLWDVSGRPLGRLPTNLGAIPGGEHVVGDGKASPDFSHYIFSSRDLAFAPNGVTGAPGTVYDNDISRHTVQIISTLPDGSPIPQEPANSGDSEEYMLIPQVSTDGSHVLMSAATSPLCYSLNPEDCPPKTPVHLYMRVNDSTTYDVSKGPTAFLVGMTADGGKVFFTSSDQLVSGDTDHSVDLYMWTEASDTLTVVSQGNGRGNSDECTAAWTSGCDVSPLSPSHGKTQFGEPGSDDYIASQSGDVYFYSPEQLDPANPGVPNERNLYVYRDGAVRYVATLDPGTSIERSQISPDGAHAAFITTAQLTPYENEGHREMYTYRSSDGNLRCVSCMPDGGPPTSEVEASQGGRFMSNDGRAFFATADALVPQDTDNLIDVYEFVDGRPQLISSGHSQQDSYPGAAFYPGHPIGLEGVSENGIDVYFTTFDTLVGQDHNGEFVKFYDARTNGGFASEPPLAPCAAADECHAAGSVPPPTPGLSTAAGLGSGGQVRSPHHAAKHRHHKRHHRRKRAGRTGQAHG